MAKRLDQSMTSNKAMRAIIDQIKAKNEPETPKLTEELIINLSGLDTEESLELLYQLQSLGLVQGLKQPLLVSNAALENILPEMLKELSGDMKSLLTDDQGFYMATYGFHHEAAEELAALAVELSKLQGRYSGLLKGNLNLQSAAFGLINTGGQSNIGFWPLTVGEQRFTLVLGGIPYLNKNVIVELIWVLVNRYHSNYKIDIKLLGDKPMRSEVLTATLSELNGTSADIEASAVISTDGLVMTALLSSGMDEDRVGAMSAAMLSLGGRTAKELARGELEQVLIRGDKGYVLMTHAGEEAVLTVVTKPSAKLGLIFLDVKRAAEAITKVI